MIPNRFAVNIFNKTQQKKVCEKEEDGERKMCHNKNHKSLNKQKTGEKQKKTGKNLISHNSERDIC